MTVFATSGQSCPPTDILYTRERKRLFGVYVRCDIKPLVCCFAQDADGRKAVYNWCVYLVVDVEKRIP